VEVNLKILSLIVLSVSVLFTCRCERRSEGADSGKSEYRDIYDDEADAERDIQAALIRANKRNTRVLLIFGANWCPWCQRLHSLFQNEKTIKRFVEQHYEIVHIDLGRRERNMDIDRRYGSPNTLGIPVFVVLDQNGTPVWTQETGSLEYPADSNIKGHDPKKVMAFLEAWAGPQKRPIE
jgi:thiol-disulfide isomerase/thioredoxin